MATFRITGGALTGVLMSDAYPDQGLPQPPLGIWGGGNVPMPSPPMAPGGGGYWGQANDPGYGVPRPPLGIWGGPWQPPYPSQGPGFPTNPIAPGGPPLGIWGPTDPRPGWGLPTPQPPLGIWGGPWLPMYPDNALPGNQPYPDQGLPGDQPRPGHALPPFATNLPVLPPQQPAIDPVDPTKAHLVAYVPKADGSGYERVTFTVAYPPERDPPTEATPKPA